MRGASTSVDRPAAGRPVLLVFLKHPEPGRVKTRLAAGVGAAEAVRIYRRLVETVADRLPDGLAVRVCCDPPGSEPAMRDWLGPRLPPGTEFVPQTDGDLGVRLRTAFGEAFAGTNRPVLAIGGDCPVIPPESFGRAVASLDAGADLVVGPSADGGYYLIALGRPRPELFEGIGWGGPDVLAQTLARASGSGLAVRRLPVLPDVDTPEDWDRVRAAVEGG